MSMNRTTARMHSSSSSSPIEAVLKLQQIDTLTRNRHTFASKPRLLKKLKVVWNFSLFKWNCSHCNKQCVLVVSSESGTLPDQEHSQYQPEQPSKEWNTMVKCHILQFFISPLATKKLNFKHIPFAFCLSGLAQQSVLPACLLVRNKLTCTRLIWPYVSRLSR